MTKLSGRDTPIRSSASPTSSCLLVLGSIFPLIRAYHRSSSTIVCFGHSTQLKAPTTYTDDGKSTVASVGSDQPRAACMTFLAHLSSGREAVPPPMCHCPLLLSDWSDWSTPYTPTAYISGSQIPSSHNARDTYPHPTLHLLLNYHPRHHHLLEDGGRSAPILARPARKKNLRASLLSVHSNSNLSLTLAGHGCWRISRLQLRCLSSLY